MNHCYDDGKLMAYLDRQLAPEQMAEAAGHISHCSGCRARLERIAGDLEESRLLLENYREAAGRAAGVGAAITSCPGMKSQKGMKMMRNNWQRWQKCAAGVAVVAIIAGLFAFAPVRSFASQLLQVFRVNQVQVLHFNPQDVQALQRSLSQYGKDIKTDSFGTVRRDELKDFARIDADRVRLNGETVGVPARIGDYQRNGEARLNPGEKLNINPKVAGINSLLKNMGGQKMLPEALDGKTFTVEIPPSVTADYINAAGKKITMVRTLAPVITVPEGVDVNQVREAILDIPILPSPMKNTLAGIDNWGKAVLIPDFGLEEQGAMEEVTVNGNHGIYLVAKKVAQAVPQQDGQATQLEKAPDNLLFWPQGNTWTGLAGQFTKDEGLTLAGTLR